MATTLIPVGAAADDSDDIVIADGAAVNVVLLGQTTPNARILIKIKDADSAYHYVDELNGAQPGRQLVGPGTFQLSKAAGVSCGAFSA